ncbi:BMP family protein [Endozoicomonas sp. OPT23]|uniref:BMP family lipoprotein n=1 Tax=Endozoicomonas sp. OPT23 TaxID=2072845 RepID=UPI001E41F35C|nr:BMP family ABC transporter substrate-binding protein [Endozoicomonas sp. OPT23]
MTVISSVFSPWVIADSFKPAIVYSSSNKFDLSFNETIFRNGIQKFNDLNSIKVYEFEPQFRSSLKKGLAEMIQAGYNPIISVGFENADSTYVAAKNNPDTHFIIIDAVVDLPNAQSITFKEHEGSYLVGVLAALTSKSNTVGFIGGMKSSLISKFSCGFAQGVRQVNPNAIILEDNIGRTMAAFDNPGKGSHLAFQQMKQGADIIYAAAGNSGKGVFKAARLKNQMVIGVDSNQNGLMPGYVLSSMVKNIGFATLQALQESQQGDWHSGSRALGLKEGGVDWALDEHNRSLISEETEQKVNKIKQQIIANEIQVHDFSSNNRCSI